MEKRNNFLGKLKVYLEEDIEEDCQLPEGDTKENSPFSLEDVRPYLEEDIEK